VIPGPWLLDPSVTHLNHGSFSAVPTPVLAAQQVWRDRWEADTTEFIVSEYEPALDRSRAVLAQLVGTRPENLVFVANATAGVNTVVRSFGFEEGDQILTTTHAYNACRNVLDFVAARTGAEVVSVDVPFPLTDASQVIERIAGAISDRTRFALIDHITSATALILPIEEIVSLLENAGVPVLVDGAHAPGMVPLSLDSLGASYYTGNHHKWLSAPKGSGFLWARTDRIDGLIPPTISHGWNDPRTDRPRFHLLFDYPGTIDFTAHLVLPEAVSFLATLHPKGLSGLMRRNRDLAITQRKRLIDFLGIEPPAPELMLGAMAALPLRHANGEVPFGTSDPLGRKLRNEYRIQVPIFSWPTARLLRISAAPYNDEADYDRLLAALAIEL
jgi:isopenicillin-N epimerase